MRACDGRTTKRIYPFAVLLEQLDPDELIGGEYLVGVKVLVDGNHPLPNVYLKQDIDGKISILGDQTRNILGTLVALRMLASIAPIIRRISSCELRATVIEYSVAQEELIQAYKDAGFI